MTSKEQLRVRVAELEIDVAMLKARLEDVTRRLDQAQGRAAADFDDDRWDDDKDDREEWPRCGCPYCS